MSEFRTCQFPAGHADEPVTCSVVSHWTTADFVDYTHQLATADRPDLAAELRASLAALRDQDATAEADAREAERYAVAEQALAEARQEIDRLKGQRLNLLAWLEDVRDTSERLRKQQDSTVAAAAAAGNETPAMAYSLREMYRAERDAIQSVITFISGQVAGTVTRG